MLGLGETIDEVLAVMRDLRAHKVDILTLGQYLRPSPKHLPIVRYVPPDEFEDLRRAGFEMGFAHVESGPLVRSSYHAADSVGQDGGGADHRSLWSAACGERWQATQNDRLPHS